ncbi:MAG: carbohydrate-binding domain-containing protein [Butyrivibrio sp.]|nr:carbohydrate-binding domain-containing protein [Butyrivibrio sp.]
MKRKVLAALLASVTLSISFSGFTSYAYYDVSQENKNLKDQSGMIRITEGGTYILQGKMSGGVFVDAGNEDVELILDGVYIDGKEGAGIVALSGSKLRITLPEGSVNKVTDGGQDSFYNAAIFSAIDTVFRGDGSLYVTGNNRNGINVNNANLIFNGGNYAVKASESGITGKDLVFNQGNFSIQALEGINPMDEFINNGASIDMPQNMNIHTFTMHDGSPSFRESAGGIGSTITTSVDGQGSENSIWSRLSNYINQVQAENIFSGFTGQSFQSAMQDNQFNSSNLPSGMQPPTQGTTLSSADSPTEVVDGSMTNSAALLEADYDNATYITVTDDDSDVEIKSSGTYVVTGSSSDGNITVKKGTSGVVLVLDDLDLTSTTGATVSINKEAEVKVIISGTVTLTDNENPDDENSADEAVADAFDGAALKAKADSAVYVTGDGTLTINGNAKNGIKGGDNSSLIFDGITMNITAANDGINSNYDVTLLSGRYTISAEDDAIHADHILTIGAKDGTGPDVTISRSNEGLEGTVVNMYGGKVSVTSTDDAVNAANGDGIYEGELDYSFNMMGGSLEINSQGDGIDSNGNVNLLGGSARINSSSAGGEAGIDYDGQLYVDDSFTLNNQSSVSGPDAAFGAPGEINAQQSQMQQSFNPEQQSDRQQQSFTPDQQSDQLQQDFAFNQDPAQMQQGFAFDQDPAQMQNQDFGPADMSFSQPMNDDFGPGSDDQGPSGDMPLLR